jgi:hypothetical protein
MPVGHERDVVQVDLDAGRGRSAARGGKEVLAAGRQRRPRLLHGHQFGRKVEVRRVRQQVRVPHHEHVLELRVRAHLVDHGQQGLRRHDHARLQVVELVLQLVLLEQRPAGADDGAQLLDAVVRHHVLRAVVHEQGDRLALLHAQLRQPRGEGVARAVELREADGPPVPHVGGLVGLLARMLPEKFVQGLLDQGCCLHRVTSLGFMRTQYIPLGSTISTVR